MLREYTAAIQSKESVQLIMSDYVRIMSTLLGIDESANVLQKPTFIIYLSLHGSTIV